jgi:hypothetical protein
MLGANLLEHRVTLSEPKVRQGIHAQDVDRMSLQ